MHCLCARLENNLLASTVVVSLLRDARQLTMATSFITRLPYVCACTIVHRYVVLTDVNLCSVHFNYIRNAEFWDWLYMYSVVISPRNEVEPR